MGEVAGGNPTTVADAGLTLTTAAKACESSSAPVSRTGSIDGGVAEFTAALDRFAAAGGAYSSALTTQLDALAMLAKNGATDLAGAGGEPVSV